jgi:Ca2+-transporting ATPase
MKVEFVYSNGISYSTKDPLPDNPGLDMIKNICYFNNDSYIENGKEFGDPTEIALLNLSKEKDSAYKQIRFNRADEIPFDSTRKMMSTLHTISGKPLFFTKGAFEEVVKCCHHVLDQDKVLPLKDPEKEKFENIVLEWSKNGYRVLALAYKENIKEVEEHNLILAGLVALRDPIRSEVFLAIQKCKEAGIRVIMMTGDHLETAKAYARELNIISVDDSAYNHQDMAAMTEDELSEALETTNVFARITPEDKYRVVNSLKMDGEIVAMTGDGVNDAPALRKADIGIAMGIRGTDLTKEVASLVLLDDNFATIVNAIEEGRVIYDNIKNTIFFLLSCNLGEILLVIGAIVLNLKMPMGPLHLLWLNLITDSFPALALGFEKAGLDVMKPRNDTKNNFLTRGFFGRIMLQAVFIGGGSFFLFFRHYNAGILEATTVCFTGLIVIELLRALSARSQSQTILKLGLFSNPYMIYSLLLSFGFLLIALYGPVAILFKSVSLSGKQWGEIIIVSLLVLLMSEGRKMFFKIKS